MRTLTQAVLSEIPACLNQFGEDPSKNEAASKYLTAARQTAARIHNCGIEQSICFLGSRLNKEPAKLLYEDLARIIHRINYVESQTNLLDDLKNADFGMKTLMTSQVLTVCNFISLVFTGAGVKPDDNDDDTEQKENQ